MKPKCFCKPQVPDCPKCSRPDYSKIRPSNGSGNSGAMVKTRINLRREAVAA